MKKYPISFRLTEQAQILLKRMAEKLGVSQVAIIELAIREKAQKIIDASITSQNVDAPTKRGNS